MAKVTFTPEKAPPPLDQTLDQMGAAALALGKTIRVRIQPDIYDYGKRQYNAWSFVTWVVDLENLEQGRALREGLQGFLRVFGLLDPAQYEAMHGHFQTWADELEAARGPERADQAEPAD